MKHDLFTPMSSRFMHHNRPPGADKFESLHLVGKATVVLDSPLESGEYAIHQDNLPIPYARTYKESTKQLFLKFVNQADAENFFVLLQYIINESDKD